ncbi:DDT domain superfamily [Actinidia rufa]|uniref:DDT domain superfamily n=1 Tax=Actinidia rufa TaxID=165716 RepID=A0A7J0GMP5_9ERIC|nr:DDT domain superfamily [Actinidia rufa]
MQSLVDLRCDPTLDNPVPPDLPTMIHDEPQQPQPQHLDNNHNAESNHAIESKDNGNSVAARRERPSRACTARASARLHAAAVAVTAERRQKAAKKERRVVEEEEPPLLPQPPQYKIVTPLVGDPPLSQLPRWSLRSMWELASILNFLNVFRPLLNIKVEFSAEEFETALITPNNTLGDVHIPLLKVAEGELPIVASHGAEVEAYNTLDPGVRVLILKAICDIRVEILDVSVNVCSFRKNTGTMNTNLRGISAWPQFTFPRYEDDSIIGHRLYREIRKVEAKKVKGKNVQPIPSSSYHWETVATNLDEFQDVSEKLFSSKNKTEASLGKKLKNDMLPEIEKVHKRKERLLKKQHREALLLDNMIVDGVGAGRSLRDRKPVTYTFDDYDRSINEAISLTKRKHPSPEPIVCREFAPKADASINGRWTDASQIPEQTSFDVPSPKSSDYDEMEMDHKPELLDRNNRRRQRPQRYSAKEFVEALSDNEVDADSDDDIVGEVVYNEEYLRQRKQRRKMSSSSEGDEEYHWDEENAEDEEEEEEDDDDLSMSEDSDEPKKFKKLPGRTRRETKLRSVDQLEPEEHTDTDNAEFSMGSEDSEGDNDNQEIKVDQPVEHSEAEEKEQNQPPEKSNSPDQDEIGGVRKRRLLDLNELAPGSGFEDGPNTITKDEDTGDF